MIQQQGTRKKEYTCLGCSLLPRWNTLRFNQATVKTTITHNNFRHCLVSFSPFVRQPFSKQLFTGRGKPLYCCLVLFVWHIQSTNQSVNQPTNQSINQSISQYPSINQPPIDQSIKQLLFFNNNKLFPYDTREIFISFPKDHNKKYVAINHENRCSM